MTNRQTSRPSVPPQNLPNASEWRRIASNWIMQANQGRLNCTGSVTLTANAFSTTVQDKRVGANSCIDFMPTTANAATELASGGMYISAQQGEQFTITHASNAQSDRTFTYTIMG